MEAGAARAGDAALPAPAKPVERKSGFRDFLEEMGELTVFCFQAVKALPGTLRYFSEILRLNAVITRRTSLLLFVMCMFLGISLANFGFYFLRSIGASDFVGVLPGLITPRQTAPQMFGYVFAGSVCCAIAAELGAARIQEEIDAYEAQGIDPMQFLVGTRILAAVLFVPLASALAQAGMIAGGYALVVLLYKGNNSQQFFDVVFSVFPLKSYFFCTITIALVAIQCCLVACFYGMRPAPGGPASVGRGVARSLAVNIVLLHFVFSLAAIIFYGGSLGVPIGD
jgi:phospholipid/cholesterol/gamma-HCH transport system permease protein